jgi:glycosyltransferase involved in cell wall biosynthesis
MNTERLSVLHVHGQYFRAGGAETYLRGLVAAQRSRGHRAGILYSSERPAGHVDSPDEMFCPPSYGIRSGFKVRDAVLGQIAAWRPRIVHLHVTQYSMSPWLIRGISADLPTVHTVHDTLFLCLKGIGATTLLHAPRILPDKRPCLRRVGLGCHSAGCVSQLASRDGWRRTLFGEQEVFYRVETYRRLHRLLVNSQFTRQELVRNGFADDRISVVGTATDFPPAWEQAIRDDAAEEHPPLVLFVGKLVPAKGCLLLLEVLERLSRHAWQAIFVGDGSETHALTAFVEQRGWNSRVCIQPAMDRDRLGELYRRARLVVFPSLWPETWGLVGIEAMRFGRPVVAFDSGAVSEWLDDGATGYLVPWGDVEAMTARVERLLLDAGLARHMGQEARRKAERLFRMDDHVDRVINTYREVLTGQRSKDRARETAHG